MADKTIEEFIVENKWNPFPLVRYTERPDVAAQHILEGHVVVIIDNTPSVLILPTTFFDSLEHAEEYRQTPAVGTTMRWIRIIAIRSEEHTSELQSRGHLVCRLLLETKQKR